MSISIDLNVPGYEGHTGFTVVMASTAILQDRAYRLRYFVYVDVMKRTQLYADHAKRKICEPLDENGIVYLAIFNGKMIGTIRRNLLSDPAAQYYRELYQTKLFDLVRADRVAITTKLMLLPEFQRTKSVSQLIRSYAIDQYKDGIQLDIIDSNEHLIPFFERLGYFSYIGWVDHKEYGQVRPMFLAQDAVEYLKEIKSLLAPIAESALKDNAYGGYRFIKHLAQEPALEDIRRTSARYRAEIEETSQSVNDFIS